MAWVVVHGVYQQVRDLVPGIEDGHPCEWNGHGIADADWVITGEGQFDEQSLRGKVVSGIAKLASKHGAKVAVLAGSIQVSEEVYRREGIELALSTMKPRMELNLRPSKHAEELLASVARELAVRIVR